MPGALPEGKVQGTFLGQSLFGHGFMINEPRDRASEFVSTEDALSPVLLDDSYAKAHKEEAYYM